MAIDTNLMHSIHKNICFEVHEMYVKKNLEYGNSFNETRDIVPNAILVRLLDKVKRITQLMQNPDVKVVYESVDDNLYDLANYAIMELSARQYDKTRYNVMNMNAVNTESVDLDMRDCNRVVYKGKHMIEAHPD